MIYGKNGDLGYSVSYELGFDFVDEFVCSETGKYTEYRFTLVDTETGKKIRLYTCETLNDSFPTQTVPVYMRKLLAGNVETVVFSTRRNFTYWGGDNNNHYERVSMEISHFADINSINEIGEMLKNGGEPHKVGLWAYIEHMEGVHWYNELSVVKFVEHSGRKTLGDTKIIYRIDGETGALIFGKLDSGKVPLFDSQDIPNRTEPGYVIVTLTTKGCMYMDRPTCTLYVGKEPKDMNKTGYTIKGVSRNAL